MTTQPESKVSTAIMKKWKAMGCKFVYKVHGGEYQMAGVPDISGIYLGHSIWCETKMPGNRPSMVQWKRIHDIRCAGGLVVIAYSVSDAVQMISHIDASDCTHAYNKCLYSEHINLLEKQINGDFK